MNFKEYLAWLDENRAVFPNKPIVKKPPSHPGRVLREDYLTKLGIAPSDFARQLGCRFATINGILNERRSITPEFPIQLESLLGVPAEAWVSLQGEYDLWKVRQRMLD